MFLGEYNNDFHSSKNSWRKGIVKEDDHSHRVELVDRDMFKGENWGIGTTRAVTCNNVLLLFYF